MNFNGSISCALSLGRTFVLKSVYRVTEAESVMLSNADLYEASEKRKKES